MAREVFEVAWGLHQALRVDDPIRLLGVRVEGLATVAGGAPRQLVLGSREHGWREAEQAADAAVARFGARAVRPASLLPDKPESSGPVPS